MYETFLNWFNNDTHFDNNNLPTMSFSLTSLQNGTYYIPLSSLLIDSSVIISEPGAPYINIKGIIVIYIFIL